MSVSIEIFNTKILFLNAGRSFLISSKTDIRPDFQLTILMTLLVRKLLGFRQMEVLWLAPEVDYSSLLEPSAKRASGPQSFSHYQLGILTVANCNHLLQTGILQAQLSKIPNFAKVLALHENRLNNSSHTPHHI